MQAVSLEEEPVSIAIHSVIVATKNMAWDDGQRLIELATPGGLLSHQRNLGIYLHVDRNLCKNQRKTVF
ncbi:unnamed protein product [Nippostrongylus brasiliensis]|uniref:Uncharacterized protein n=1 Tax=Nippostrongylus brasiliensis TaxID=27835 RepID=A0A0N4XYJ8_NIPBR|nr:unnamed protein product [Nippostrongylus brasiliensis]